ncbi:MAG: type II secretion system protein [Planctomycetota bacterium]
MEMQSTAKRRAFTLVEMLVVVAIIGILASLISVAAAAAMRHAWKSRVKNEVTQLSNAMVAFKEKFGDYPPDFTGADLADKEARIERFLAKAFPRYQAKADVNPNNGTKDWKDHLGNMIGTTRLTQLLNSQGNAGALVLWLGGEPILSNDDKVTGFAGFSANPRNPFEKSTVTSTRIGPFFDFAPDRIRDVDADLTDEDALWYCQVGSQPNDTEPYLYFRARVSANQFAAYDPSEQIWTSGSRNIRPVHDKRLGKNASNNYAWPNVQTFQIRAAGGDGMHGTGTAYPDGAADGNATVYDAFNYDDSANFITGVDFEADLP